MADASDGILAGSLKSGDSANMEAYAAPGVLAANGKASLRLLILSDIRFLREGLAEILTRGQAFQITSAENIAEALVATRATPPDLILIDAALPDGLAAAGRLRELAPEIHLVALAVAESGAEVIAWAEAGVSGYLPRSAALSDLVGYLKAIMRGEQACSARVAAGLLRWIAKDPHTRTQQPHASAPPLLTAREEEIAYLIGGGSSNKEIARRLAIGLATTKSHVHNLLGKLGLARRTQVARLLRDYEGPKENWGMAGPRRSQR
jgi:DNA-binding NarL/FixJ family response regulator